MMKAGTGKQNRFKALPARELETVQMSYLIESFELVPRSHLGEAVVEKTNQALKAYEAETGAQRLTPGELLLELDGKIVSVPLMTPYWGQKLADDCKFAAVRRHLEFEQLTACQAVQADFDLEKLWHFTDQKELVSRRGGKEYLPEQPLDANSLGQAPRNLETVSLPDSLLKPLAEELNSDYGVKPALAKAMAQKAAQVRWWCSPRLKNLKPGQVVWLAYSTQSRKRGPNRLLVPVVLTLLSLDEQNLKFSNRGDYKALKIAQIERITAEAWQQGGALTMLDLELLLNLNGATLRAFLNDYQEHFGVLLPTAGTVLDMGRTLTHKKIVVEMSLAGLSTQQIAQKIFHTPEAVDQYLRLFDRVLVLYHYHLPINLIRQVTGHSLALIKEHLALVDKHFPTKQDLIDYLSNRGVELENAQ
jgi:hypothetical protein